MFSDKNMNKSDEETDNDGCTNLYTPTSRPKLCTNLENSSE